MKEENAKQLERSISELGDLSCIVFNERTGQLVGGHQRKSVITTMIGENPEIVITKTYEEPNEVGTTKEGYITVKGENYKVRFVDFSEEKEHLAIIIANDKRNQGEYDFDLLPTVIDIASNAFESQSFDLMELAEIYDIGGNMLGEMQTGSKHVEFEAKNKEIGVDDLEWEAILKLTFNQDDYPEVMRKLNELQDQFGFDNKEDVILKLLGI